jgi:hypothetical protein
VLLGERQLVVEALGRLFAAERRARALEAGAGASRESCRSPAAAVSA